MSPLLHGEVAVYRRATELVEQRRADAEIPDSAASRRGLHVKAFYRRPTQPEGRPRSPRFPFRRETAARNLDC